MASINYDKIIQQMLSYKEINLKKFVGKYSEALLNYDNLSSQDFDAYSKDILQELEGLEFQIHKAEMNHHSRVKDHNYHLNLCEKFDKNVKQTLSDIETLNQELQSRYQQVRNKQEYEVISGQINQYESTNDMIEKIENIQNEINDLTSKYQNQREKIELKEKQLFQLISSINELQDIVAGEKMDEEGEEKPNN